MAEAVGRNEQPSLWIRVRQSKNWILQKIRALETRFFILLAGETNGAHHDFTKELKGVGHSEVFSSEGCDYTVCFCPVASRVGTNVSEALNKIPADKPTVLVVMHHTFDPTHVVAESRRLVNNPNVLTVDCLFYENHFLSCKRNDAAWDEVRRHLGVSPLRVRLWKTSRFLIWLWSSRRFRLGLGALLVFGLWYKIR